MGKGEKGTTYGRAYGTAEAVRRRYAYVDSDVFGSNHALRQSQLVFDCLVFINGQVAGVLLVTRGLGVELHVPSAVGC